MVKYLSKSLLTGNIRSLGISCGDTVLIRAALSTVGPLRNGPRDVIDAFLDVIGTDGTLVSLSFTHSSFLKNPDSDKPFTLNTPTYAGAFPNTMLAYAESKRSKHPTCSYVAIGRKAEWIVADHGPESPAYEPVRKILDLNGKMALIGCVSASPGFTTTHLAEYDLKLFKRVIFPRLNTVYYKGDNGEIRLFRRKDMGLCSNSFHKFYSYYVKAGILRTGFVGNAYSISVNAKEAYALEKQILSANPQFTVCDNPLCFLCNARRWDRIHQIPLYIFRRVHRKLKNISR